MENLLPILKEFALNYGIKVVGAIVVLIAGRIVAGVAKSLVKKGMNRSNADPAIRSFVSSLVFNAVIVFAVMSALGSFGVETASLVAVLGAVGFAVGFALQGSLSNFASGIMLLAFRPYRIGDYVEAGGVAGTIKAMHMFTTVLNTPDNIRIIVPNSKIFGDTIKNYSAEDTRRVDMTVGIGYGSSIEKALEVIKGLLATDPRVLPEPVTQIVVGELADSSVNIIVRPWAKKEDYWGLKFDFTHAVKDAFDREGIEIPFPQIMIHKPE